ncbi:MAG: FAD:protein FMN transferase [Oligoflexia bacterium]|nr:FAD:protein FMN transferase [Oligoflexia bacterium]
MGITVEDKSTIRLNHRFKAMGGEFQLLCFPQNDLSKEQVLELFNDAESEVKRIELKFTDFCDSEFNEINKYAGLKPVEVDNEIISLIKKSLDISNKSNGAFDISYASIGHLWREAKKEKRTLSTVEREKIKNFVDYKKIEINEVQKIVYLPHREMKIGLGGIGKGYAVDQVFNLLKSKGLNNFYVNGSGDIRVHSHKNAPRPWRIGIKNPFSKNLDRSVGYLQLKEGSVASSGSYIQYNELEKDYSDHHILNPKSGLSNNDLITTTVVAETALEADTTATILMNFSTMDALKYLNEYDLLGFLIDSTGKTHLSKKALAAFGVPQ